MEVASRFGCSAVKFGNSSAVVQLHNQRHQQQFADRDAEHDQSAGSEIVSSAMKEMTVFREVTNCDAPVIILIAPLQEKQGTRGYGSCTDRILFGQRQIGDAFSL